MKEVLIGLAIWFLFSLTGALAFIGFVVSISMLLGAPIDTELLAIISMLLGGLFGLFAAMGLCAK